MILEYVVLDKYFKLVPTQIRIRPKSSITQHQCRPAKKNRREGKKLVVKNKETK